MSAVGSTAAGRRLPLTGRHRPVAEVQSLGKLISAVGDDYRVDMAYVNSWTRVPLRGVI